MYPKQVKAIHQIEITSRCNLRCRYCVHPTMGRVKKDMDGKTFIKALFMVQECVARYGQKELNMAGIGESLMHPEFELFFDKAREALPGIFIALATNGILLNDERAKILKRNKVATWISLHRPEKAGLAVEIAKKYGILHGVSTDPALAAIDWAGKVKWYVTAPISLCPWLSIGRAMVCADGMLTTCCLDGEGAGKIGTVDTPLEDLTISPYSLCEPCHHLVPE